ncbi:hypothetical protein TNCV_3086881 [Trichonephila clavipes]|nr:hypothetical protein TNCV_3086881 [Trichonephila clavipes]
MKLFNEAFQCGVSVDGTWQRKGHLSLNGCVSVISIDTSKVLDIEVLSKMCRLCSKKTEDSISHECEKRVGHMTGKERKDKLNETRRVENREGSLVYPGVVTPTFAKDSKSLGKRKRSLEYLEIVTPVLT